MILIKNKQAERVIYVPKFWQTSSALTFTLRSRVTNDEFSDFVEDLSSLTDYFVVSIDTSSLNDGEYEYSMYDNGNDDEKVSTGLLRIGDYEAEKDEYNYTQEYVQYIPAEEENNQYYTK